MTVVDARGLRFHVRRLGAGRPVVMLHGLITGSMASWYLTCAPRLADRWSPFLIDQRGHGRSERALDGYGAGSLAEDLHALTGDLPPFPIIAHSYGCLVAARFAAAHPDRVLGLAMVEPPFGLHAARDLDVDALTVAGRALGSRAAARIRALLRETTLLADVADESELGRDEIDALPPVLLAVFGDRSPCRAGAEAVRRTRPDADVVVLPGDHDVHTQSTEALTEELSWFLGRVERRSLPEPVA